MKTERKEDIVCDVDILGSIEFDFSEAIKDLIYNIKTIKKDVDMIKQRLELK